MTLQSNSNTVSHFKWQFLIALGIFCLLLSNCIPPANKLGIPKGTYPCRQYLSSESEENGFGFYGYILFKEIPSNDDSLFYKEIYSAFLNITELDSLPATIKVDKKRLAVIYWLIKAAASEKEAASYEKKIKNWPYYFHVYDYAKARLIADNLEKCQGKNGPFIVSSRFPLLSLDSISRYESDSIFVIDLSALPSECIKPTFRNYQTRLMRDSGFFSLKFSERLIDLRRKVACGIVAMEENAAFLTAVIDVFKPFDLDIK